MEKTGVSIGLRSWGVFFLLLLITFIPSSAQALIISDLTVANSRSYILAYFSLNDIPYEKVKEALRHGIPVRFRFEVELFELRRLRRDRRILFQEVSRIIYFDHLKNTYLIHYPGTTHPIDQTMDFKEALKMAAEINDLPLIPLQQLRPQSHYRLRVRGFMEKVTSPSLPSKLIGVLFFRKEAEATDWATIRFRL
ncbi:DUF4390 domain-containing protein [Thermosulfuriphilus sp.]